jgi:two-component system, cell cycle sensor histidine kinase and response regulator CckA
MNLAPTLPTDRRQRRKLIALLGVVVLAAMLLFAYLIWSSYQEAIHEAETKTRNYSAIFETRLDATLRRADADLQELARSIPAAALSPQAVPRYAPALNAELDFRVNSFKEMASLRIFDADGELLYTSASASSLRVPISDQSQFRELRDNPQAGLVFSDAVISRISGKQSVFIGRALQDGQGAFRGAVFIGLDVERFQRLLQSLDLGAHGIIAIRRSDDFTQVVRWPPLANEIDKTLPRSSPIRDAITAGTTDATMEFRAVTDGVVRIFSFRKLERYPFFVLTALARDDVLAGWRTRALAVGTAGVLLLLLLGNLLFRLWRAETSLVASEELMRNTFEQAAVGIAHIAPDNYRILRANKKTCELLGYTHDELIGMDSRTRTPADEMPAREAERAQLVTGKVRTSSCERRLIRKDGSSLWVNRSLSLVRDPAGKPLYFISVIEDVSERRRTEQALRDSEARFRAIFDHAGVGIAMRPAHDRKLPWVQVNDQLCKLLGYTREELLKLSAADITPSYERDIAVKSTERLLRGEIDNYVRETRVTRKDGRNIWVNLAVTALPDADGHPRNIVAIYQDITERKLTQDALQILSTGVAHLRGETFFNQLSEQVSRLLGVEIGFVGKLLAPGNDRIRILGLWTNGGVMRLPVEYGLAGAPCEAVIDTGVAIFPAGLQQLFPSERMLVDLNAESYAAVALLDSNDRTIGHIGVMSRAPLRRSEQAESILRLFAVRAAAEVEREATEAKFHDLFEYSPDASIIVNQAGHITQANRQAEALFGYARAELIGLEVDKLMPQEKRQGHPAKRRLFFAGAASRRMGAEAPDLCAQRKDGTIFPVEIGLSPLQSDEGMLAVATVRDITARVQADKDRKALEAQLRQSQKMEAIGTLAGGIAHDFNNVISAIIGNVELAREDVGADHPAMQSLDEIRKAGRRARDLVSQILAFSRVQPQPRRTVALAPLVEEVVKLLRATLPAGIALGTALAEDVPSVLADPTQIHQILMNLCTNAWHAMDHGQGRIDIQIDTVVLGEKAVRSLADLQPGHYAHLSVHDNGKGMDAATLERIFEPFFTTKAVGEGTGLGLSVVHGIMRGYQGAIAVNSQPGGGTTFHLYFPAASAAAGTAAAEKARAVPPLRGRGQHVLYIDDDDALVRLVTRMLERSGYRVTAYTKSAHALQAVRADPRRFDLMVTDYNMPGMSGLDVAREVSRIRPDLPIVVTSGYITDELREQAPRAGVRQLVYKPDSAEELCETVRELLDGGK